MTPFHKEKYISKKQFTSFLGCHIEKCSFIWRSRKKIYRKNTLGPLVINKKKLTFGNKSADANDIPRH